jgi:hypothetical protein
MVCTEAEGNGFDSGLDSGFKSILRSNAGRGGIVLARSNKASATSTSSETVGVDDTFSSFGTLGFDPLGFVLLLGFKVTAEDDERVLDGAGVGEAIGGSGCCCAAGVSTTGVGGDSCARFGTAERAFLGTVGRSFLTLISSTPCTKLPTHQ